MIKSTYKRKNDSVSEVQLEAWAKIMANHFNGLNFIQSAAAKTFTSDGTVTLYEVENI